MKNRSFKNIFIKIKYTLMWLNKYNKQLFNLILPNLLSLIYERKRNFNYPICNQKLFLRGAGTVEIGKNCIFGYKRGGYYKGGSIEIQPRYKNSLIKIGSNVITNNNLFFCAANFIEIGNDSIIGNNVCIMDHEAHGISPDKRRQIGEIGNVIIGKNVWIGNNVTILKNSKIGNNTIIATGSVVSGKFPENVIIGGVPAKIIKKLI